MAEWHAVQQGECLSSLAAEHNLASWRSIYNRPENAAFRSQCPNPNLIYPGDQVFIPDPKQGGVDKPTDHKHTFVLMLDQTMLRIVLADQDGNPYAPSEYSLTIGDNNYEGKADAEA